MENSNFDKSERLKNEIFDLHWGLGLYKAIIGGLAAFGACMTMQYFGARAELDSKNFIPKVEAVQERYINPSNLEITCEDNDKSDRKGLPETYIRIKEGKGKGRYLLRYSEKGIPVISKFKMRPVEIIPE